MSAKLANLVMQRIAALAKISEEPGRLTRTYGSDAMRRANELVGSWMHEAGMAVRTDAIGNLIGRYEGMGNENRGSRIEDGKIPSLRPTFLLGSHLDTVRDAGKFDGPLGVIVAIACVQHLREKNISLPFAIEVVGFCDEEGVRFQSTYLGSKVLAGTFDAKNLKRADTDGITLADAIRNFGGNPDDLPSARLDPKNILGYAEVHIEQGPVLEKQYQPVGVVTAIAGQTRIKICFKGEAGHAGTVPMFLRKDALVAAATFIFWIEHHIKKFPHLVATVGRLEVQPGASNVIPGEVNLTLDVRDQSDEERQSACECLRKSAEQIQKNSGLEMRWEVVQETPAVKCSSRLKNVLIKASRQHLEEVCELTSGAGHDAAAMADVAPVAMLFVRCKGGVSHNPAESADLDDVQVAVSVMNDFLQQLAREFSK